MAKKINVPQSAISRFESQANSPRLDTLLEIAEALGAQLIVSKSLTYTVNLPRINYDSNINVCNFGDFSWSNYQPKQVGN